MLACRLRCDGTCKISLARKIGNSLVDLFYSGHRCITSSTAFQLLTATRIRKTEENKGGEESGNGIQVLGLPSRRTQGYNSEGIIQRKQEVYARGKWGLKGHHRGRSLRARGSLIAPCPLDLQYCWRHQCHSTYTRATSSISYISPTVRSARKYRKCHNDTPSSPLHCFIWKARLSCSKSDYTGLSCNK